MRVLVCGGRDFNDAAVVDSALDRLHRKTPVTVLIHGAAPGADSLADAWAIRRSVEIIRFKADWEKFGRSAGPRRNEKMLGASRPELVVAFPGGRGTMDMLRRAAAALVLHVQVDRKGMVRGFGSKFFESVSP